MKVLVLVAVALVLVAGQEEPRECNQLLIPRTPTGRGLKNEYGLSVGQCCQECLNDPACTAYRWTHTLSPVLPVSICDTYNHTGFDTLNPCLYCVVGLAREIPPSDLI